jgi:hypothetical protein
MAGLLEKPFFYFPAGLVCALKDAKPAHRACPLAGGSRHGALTPLRNYFIQAGYEKERE